ncbi:MULTISPECIES: hypothetical protein [Haloferax]|uniref:DUF4149 domain-containing protein n=2 Tax=Haloferax TaxID=2251 RepID=A0A6G1Z112_9EURY|nr:MULTISPECIES: hypothetical protein [Haloferax]KAB1187620.1 hypothetical protein Hfx1149_06080 [Haloferax sp. CBA1149]MRW80279.1 hypothetical protein [Haloferax marinisediminis]
MLPALIAAFGLVELLFPDRFLDVVTRMAYEGDGDMTPKSWVRTVVRIEGAVLVLLALFIVGRRSSGGDEADD